jgi:transposase
VPLREQILPMLPQGVSAINTLVGVWREEEEWTYFLGTYPIYSHRATDLRMFRLVTSQLIKCGACRSVEIMKTFGVSKSSVVRSLRKLRGGGAEAFFTPRNRRRGGTVLTKEVVKEAQELLNKEYSIREAAKEMGIRYDTVRKAITDGRLRQPVRQEAATSKSSRDVVDTHAADSIGTACTRVEERVLASFGISDGALIRFESSLDVPHGGVLCALPSLLVNGVLEGAERVLGQVKGYYRMVHVVLLLAFMALCRIKTVEQLRGHAPGEFGKLLGLDRVPEVRCLRRKMDELSAADAAEKWAAHLSTHWMECEPESVGTLYVDGHVRVYHGGLTNPPRRYVSRERLCLRGTTEYWVNDVIGRPFFVVEKAIDPGLLKTLEEAIVPRLLKEVPGQPSEQELEADRERSRFVVVFDREGYSPAFFRKMWQDHRIGCISYHKHPSKAWPEQWFSEHEVRMPQGELVKMRLAEMGTLVGSGKDALWMKEVRKLTDSGHQTSLISTAYELPHTRLAACMFSRWCQENFFRYMMHHFAIDLLVEYGAYDFPDTERVVNPAWREGDRTRNSVQNKLRYLRACFAEMTIHPESEEATRRYSKWLEKKSTLLEQIEHYEHQLEEVKGRLKGTPKHITWGQLEQKDTFQRLRPGRKRLMDTIRMIAYRAETAMTRVLVSPTVDAAAARRVVQNLFATEADILPDPDNNLLRVRIHGASRPAANRSLEQLFAHLNEADVLYPGTDMRLSFELRAKCPNLVQMVSPNLP